jgi:hypothetical protein
MISLRASAFYDYLNEREAIRLRKEADRLASENFETPQGPPWTKDPILREYKFTNVRRHHDKTSAKLREMFYGEHFFDDHGSVLMNCALFRYFGTWEFAEAVGWQEYDTFDFDGIKDLAEQRLADRERVFTGAYVITNQGISAPKQEVVVDYFLKDLHKAVPQILKIKDSTYSWQTVSDRMRLIGGFGGTGFMTKEVLLDTTYTDFWENVTEHPKDGSFSYPEDWHTWTPIGPGARRGAARAIGDDSATPISEQKSMWVINELMALQQGFWKHDDELVPTDIQFALCEFDKYERVRLGQGKPRSRYRA